MDICADLMAAQMELNGRGWKSRADRVALMRKRGGAASSSAGTSSVMSENPLRRAEAGEASPKPGAESKGAAVAATSSSAAAPADGGKKKERGGGLFFAICWFMVSTGMMGAWTAMMAFIGPFKAKFGGEIFLKMNAAYYGPALPILIINIHYGKKMDAAIGAYKGYLIRGGINTVLLTVLMAIFPTLAPTGEAWVLICSFCIGVFGGMAYGCAFQFNALFPRACASLFSMGMFAPSFVYLFFHLAVNFQGELTPAKAEMHWYVGAALSAAALVALLAILHHPEAKEMMADLDAKYAAAAKAEAGKAKGDGEALVAGTEAEDTSTTGVAKTIKVCIISNFVAIFAIVAVSVYFTGVKSDGMLGSALPVTLFYVKSGCDFLGRVFTLFPLLINNQKVLGWAVAFRFSLAPIFFIYALGEFFLDDVFLLILIAVSGVTSGYINTCVFVVGGKVLNNPVAKGTGAALMNLTVQASLITSILFAAILFAVA